MKTLKSLHIENFHIKNYGRNRKFNVAMLPPSGNTLDEIGYYQINAATRYCYCQLIISLNMFLEQDNIGATRPTYDKDEYEATAWPAHEWNQFKDEVKKQSTFWDKRFWLIVNGNALNFPAYSAAENDLAYFITVRPGEPGFSSTETLIRSCPRTIECRFFLNLVDSITDAHSHVHAIHLVDKESGDSKGIDGEAIRANYNHWHNGNIALGSYHHSTIAHEIGHNIGLMHEGVTTDYEPCVHKSKHWYNYVPFLHFAFQPLKPDYDAQACYRGPYEMDVMGLGNEVHEFDALPWQKALQAITGIPYHNYTVRLAEGVSHDYKLINLNSVRWRDLSSQL